MRAWTKANHYAIHDVIARHLGLIVADRFWNEHNFVFQKPDGLFYHAKGATPAFANFAPDTNGLTLIPLNMAQPILIARGRDAANGLGFAPHGAGRNFSRSAYLRRHAGKTPAEMMAEQTAGIDARFGEKTVVKPVERGGLDRRDVGHAAGLHLQAKVGDRALAGGGR